MCIQTERSHEQIVKQWAPEESERSHIRGRSLVWDAFPDESYSRAHSEKKERSPPFSSSAAEKGKQTVCAHRLWVFESQSARARMNVHRAEVFVGA